MNQTEAGMDFPRRCLQSCGAEQRPLSPGKKNQNTNAELNVCGVLQWTLKISPIHEIAQLKMRLRCSIAAPAVSSACWFYVVDVGRLFFFFVCLFVCLFLLEEKLLWLTFRGALFMKHNHYIPYPSPPATSAPDSLWSSICVWGNTMDKRSVQYRLKSSHLAAPFQKCWLTDWLKVVNKGFVFVGSVGVFPNKEQKSGYLGF